MTPELWQKVDAVFNRASDLEGEARNAYLDEACGADTALRDEVESLLLADRDAPQVLKGCVGVTARRLIDELFYRPA